VVRLVGCVGLPVDAVRVDLEQDGDAVPGADITGSLGRPADASLRNTRISRPRRPHHQGEVVPANLLQPTGKLP
jgi:hypothetical protein